MENVDPEWAEHRIRSGMSSGEGLIFHVRDPVSALRKGEMIVIDPGVTDKRAAARRAANSSRRWR